MTSSESLTEALVKRFAESADDIALIALGEGGPTATATATGATTAAASAQQLTYGELDRLARSLAVWLQRSNESGRPVVICMDTGPHFAVSVLGCLYAGAIAVPVPPPGISRAAVERTAAIAEESGADLVLTEARLAPEVSRRLAGHGRGGLVCLAVDTGVRDSSPEDWRPPHLTGASVALIQYTSGTTAAPRGVMVTHANLLATMETIQRALGTDRRSRIGGWLPLHHDLGLVGQLLHPLWLGATSVLMHPQQFLARPMDWLDAVDRYGITVTAAPDSAYSRCLAVATDEDLDRLDLSRLDTAVNAAEPVSPVTMAAFARRFARSGLRPGALSPGYGLAEATLLVSVAIGAPADLRTVDAASLERGLLLPVRPGSPARTLVGCGPVVGVEVRIVDPSSRAELPDQEIGEIWVRGSAVASGYWKRRLETADSFRQATATGERGFLRTGDLGAVQDGRLYLTGRIKDVLLVDGRTLHPQEVERQLLLCGSRFASAAVFAVGGELEHLVTVQEVRHAGGTPAELATMVTQVRECLAEEFGASADGVVLVRPGTVRRTTSGKIRRSFMRELFLRGELRPLHAELAPGLASALAAPARERQ